MICPKHDDDYYLPLVFLITKQHINCVQHYENIILKTTTQSTWSNYVVNYVVREELWR
jgi:hypothetical protein